MPVKIPRPKDVSNAVRRKGLPQLYSKRGGLLKRKERKSRGRIDSELGEGKNAARGRTSRDQSAGRRKPPARGRAMKVLSLSNFLPLQQVKTVPLHPTQATKTAAFRLRDFSRPTVVREGRRGRSGEHLSAAEQLPRRARHQAPPTHRPAPPSPPPGPAPTAAAGRISCRARSPHPARAEPG